MHAHACTHAHSLALHIVQTVSVNTDYALKKFKQKNDLNVFGKRFIYLKYNHENKKIKIMMKKRGEKGNIFIGVIFNQEFSRARTRARAHTHTHHFKKKDNYIRKWLLVSRPYNIACFIVPIFGQEWGSCTYLALWKKSRFPAIDSKRVWRGAESCKSVGSQMTHRLAFF